MFLLFSQTAFAAQNTGFYFGISGGYVIPQSMTMSESYYGDTDTTLENGGFVGVKSGWLTPFTRRIMALEMEYNYIFGTDFDKSKVVDLAGGGPSTLDGTIRVHGPPPAKSTTLTSRRVIQKGQYILMPGLD